MDETRQLLPNNGPDNDSKKQPFVEMLEVAVSLLQIAIPLCLSFVAELIPDITGLIYVGNLSDSQRVLSSVGLSKTLYILIVVYLWGVSQAIDTLIPQAVGGQKNELLAIHLQRSFYMTFIASIPSFLILFYGGSILQGLCSSADDIDYDLVGTQCKYFILTVYMYVWYIILGVIPQSMGLTIQLFWCCIVGSALSYPFCVLFITYLGLGSNGFPLVIAACLAVNIALVLVFVYYRNGLLFVFRPVSLYEIFDLNGMKEYWYLCIPSAINNVFQTMIGDFALIYCLWVHSASIAVSAATIIISIKSIVVFIALAGQYSLSIQIGIYAGAGMMDKLQMAINCGKIISFLVSCVIFIVLISARDSLPRIYTSDGEIISLSSTLLYILMTAQFFSLGLMARYGIFMGLGKPLYPAIVNVVSYIALPFPLMFILLFALDLRDSLLYGTLSIFVTISCGTVISCVIMEIYLLFKVNFEQVLKDVQSSLSNSADKVTNGQTEIDASLERTLI